MKYSQLLTFLILSILIGACSTNKLNPVEADRSIKILNGNMVNLFTIGSEKPEYQALSFLMDQITSPLPYVRRANPNQAKKPYSFEESKGIYRWNTSTNAFEKTESRDKINLFFPSGEKELQLELSKFQSQSFSSRPDFPTDIEGFLLYNEQKILNIRHRATISNNLPETITTEIRGLDYTIELKLNRTQQGNDGKLLIDINLKTKGVTALAANVDALIEYSRYGYFFKTIDFELKLIDHSMKGLIDYAKIDPTSSDYIQSFNSNSSIILYEGRNQVGKIVLNKTENAELLDYFIKFSNNDEILLSQYLPFLKKVLNLKY